MKKHSHTPAFFLGHGAGTGRKIWSRVEQLDRLTKSLRQALPDKLASHCVVANLRNGELVIGTDSPAWAARLRFHTPGLLKYFTALPSAGVRRIRIRTLAPLPERKAPTAPPPRLSRRNSELLRKTARTIADNDLRRALNRLATRAR